MPHRQDASLSVRLVSPSTVDNHWGGGRLLHATQTRRQPVSEARVPFHR